MPKRKATVRAGWRPGAPLAATRSVSEAPGHPPPAAPRPSPSTEIAVRERDGPEDEDVDSGGASPPERDPRPAPIVATGPPPFKSRTNAVGVIDRRSRWAPGQWEAWKAHFALAEAENASLPRGQRKLVQQIVEEFNDANEWRGWSRKTVHSIRAQRSRVGEADPKYRDSRLSQEERQRALELFHENGRSWAKAVELFNEETGRNLSRGALMQSTRRMSPTSLPNELASLAAVAAATVKRAWTRAELDLLLPLTQAKVDDLHAAYISFLETMKARDANYVPRTYQGFLTELGMLRRVRIRQNESRT